MSKPKKPKQLTENIIISPKRIPGNFVVCNAYKEKTHVGRAVVILEKGEALLWDIEIIEKYRKRGYAKALLTMLKSEVDSIVTSNYSEEGWKLCVSQGFKEEESSRGYKYLVWRKKCKENVSKME